MAGVVALFQVLGRLGWGKTMTYCRILAASFSVGEILAITLFLMDRWSHFGDRPVANPSNRLCRRSQEAPTTAPTIPTPQPKP